MMPFLSLLFCPLSFAVCVVSFFVHVTNLKICQDTGMFLWTFKIENVPLTVCCVILVLTAREVKKWKSNFSYSCTFMLIRQKFCSVVCEFSLISASAVLFVSSLLGYFGLNWERSEKQETQFYLLVRSCGLDRNFFLWWTKGKENAAFLYPKLARWATSLFFMLMCVFIKRNTVFVHAKSTCRIFIEKIWIGSKCVTM